MRKLAEEGVRLGCRHCQGVLAFCSFYGRGCEEDGARSLELARQSSGRGSRYGQYTLGRLHAIVWVQEELRRTSPKRLRFISWLQRRALTALALTSATFTAVALCYYRCYLRFGARVVPRLAEALRLYQLAAAQGLPKALHRVAYCHDRGFGVAADVAAASRWYRRAQAAGHPFAANTLHRLRA